MRGAIQAAHYDHGRNFIAILKGAKRYLIQPPSACRDLLLLGRDHPSARHSSFDWAAAEETFDFESKEREKFCASEATELVLRAGQVLYLPSFCSACPLQKWSENRRFPLAAAAVRVSLQKGPRADTPTSFGLTWPS